MARRRKSIDWSGVAVFLLGALILAVFFVLILGIQWLRAGGDWGCMFTQEPQICVAIKGTVG